MVHTTAHTPQRLFLQSPTQQTKHLPTASSHRQHPLLRNTQSPFQHPQSSAIQPRKEEAMLRTTLRKLPRPQHRTQTTVPRTSPKPSQSPDSPPRRRRPPAALEVTPNAAARIRGLLSSRTPRPVGVRIGLRTRGCNGMAYTLNYADERNKFDERVQIEGAEVFIDPRALMHIVGTKMDFVDNDLVSEFVFHNPNAKGTCGCGESFNV